MTRSTAAIASIAVVTSLVPGVATAARPSPPPIFTVNCDQVSESSYPRWATAIGAPKGTKVVQFTFWNTTLDYEEQIWSQSNTGTDFDGRDGWAMFSDYPSALVVATAYNRTGTALAVAVDDCILGG